jgi:hypothetical protein
MKINMLHQRDRYFKGIISVKELCLTHTHTTYERRPKKISTHLNYLLLKGRAFHNKYSLPSLLHHILFFLGTSPFFQPIFGTSFGDEPITDIFPFFFGKMAINRERLLVLVLVQLIIATPSMLSALRS